MLAGFALSRLVYGLLGVRFDAGTLDFYWQFLDPALLRSEPLTSIWHLHAQPPLFNLYLAAVLALPEGWWSPVFALTFLACGVALALALLALQARLGVPMALRLPVTLVFTASPAAVLFENQLFYTLPTATLLVAAAWSLQRFVEGRRDRHLAAFALAVLALGLTRSIFHPLWMAAVLGLAVLAVPGVGGRGGAARGAAPRGRALRRAALAAVLVLAVVGGWLMRSWWLFGRATTSSWLGMNLARTVVLALDEPERRALAAASPATAILAVPPFSAPPAYASWAEVEPTGVAALDRPFESTGAPNLHHAVYLPVSELYRHAFAWVVTHRPGLYGRGVGLAVTVFLRDAADAGHLGVNAERAEPVARIYRPLYLGQVRRFGARLGPGAVAWTHVLLLSLGLGWALARVARRLQLDLRPVARPALGVAVAVERPAELATVVFLAGTVVWVVLTGTLLELGENNRFRFLVEPLYLVLAAAAASDLLGLRPGRGTLPAAPAGDGEGD